MSKLNTCIVFSSPVSVKSSYSPGMDSTPEKVYDTFKDEIWKELGPLDPDWFQILTAQTSTTEGNIFDPDELCANQEGNFKTPCNKTALDSQLFSTPKVFRRHGAVSPETEDERSFTNEQEKEKLPWTETESPCLFGRERIPAGKYGGIHPPSEECFDLLHTSPKSPVSYAKKISESLGAQIHPDISWTSSLNTPPAVSSTLILSKHDESPCPMGISAETNVVFVRKLFPSLDGAGCLALSPKNKDMPLHQGADQNPVTHNSTQDLQNPSVWKQKLPAAIEDGDVRSTVASILDGAETTLSLFFSNSSSNLRKVKTEKVRRKQTIPTKEHAYSLSSSPTNTAASSSEQRTDGCHPVKLSTPPSSAKDTAITQWSPLSLSDIPPSSVDSHHSVISSAAQVDRRNLSQLLSVSVAGPLVRPSLTDTLSGFTKKKRKFVYTIDTSKTQASQSQKLKKDTVHDTALEMDTSHRPTDSGYKVGTELLVKAANAAGGCRINSDEMQRQQSVQQNLHPPAQSKVQDLDMSQLCRDFAQDFSQMLDPGRNSSKVAEDAPRDGFSPSACLTAIKRAKCKERQANPRHDRDQISDCRSVPATNQTYSVNDSTVVDSGFQSAAGEITHLTTTSFHVPSTENISQGQQFTGFKSESHVATSPLSGNTRNAKQHSNNILDEAETLSVVEPPKADEQSQTLQPSREIEVQVETTSAPQPGCEKGSTEFSNNFPFAHQEKDSFPEKATVFPPFANTSGFKTASDRPIEISSAHLEKAKRLFEENEAVWTCNDRPPTRAEDGKAQIIASKKPVIKTNSDSEQPCSSNEAFGDIGCRLTASQKADVTELCTLLEEADSQFEFSECKPAEQVDDGTPQKDDKDLDPDFLMGIDFDDSFSYDAENLKMTAVSGDISKCEASKMNKSSMKKDNSTIEDVHPFSKNIPGGRRCIASAEHPNHRTVGDTQTGKQENKTPLMSGVGFKTAGGNILRISKECMKKAQALFADFEESQMSTEEKSRNDAAQSDPPCATSVTNVARGFQHSKTDTSTFQRGFQTASGKGVSVSAKALQEAGALFKDCDISESNTGMSLKQQNNTEQSPSFVGKKKRAKFKHLQESEDDEPSTSGLKKEAETPQETNKRQRSERDADQTNQIQAESLKTGGFQTASGKGVAISSAALKKAKLLFSECETVEDEFDAKPNLSKAPPQAPASRPGRFLAASVKPKPSALSAEALQKAKALFNDIDFNTQSTAGTSDKISCGFKTAAGAAVCVSRKSLMKAKHTLKDNEEAPTDTTMQEADTCMMENKRVALVTNISKEHGSRCSDSEIVTTGSDVKNQNLKHQGDAEIQGNATVRKPPCSNGDPASTPKHLSSTSGTTSKYSGSSASAAFGNSGGFFTASGKKVCVSDDALTKAKSLLNDHATNMEMDVEDGVESFTVQRNPNVPPSECNKVEVKKREKLQNTKMPVSFPALGDGGFHSASGKPVAFSSEALQRARSLFTDINVNAETVSDTREIPECEEAENNAGGKISCGFTTAGGAKVHVLQKSLLKAKNLLKECTDGESHHSASPRATHMTDLSRTKDLNKSSINATSHKDSSIESVPQECRQTLVTDRGIHQNISSVGEKVITDTSVVNEGKMTPSHAVELCNTHGEETTKMLESGRNHTRGCEEYTFNEPVDSSFLIFQPLDLGGCSKAQQELLAQEALDCTKALLEDESLTGQNLSATLEKEPKIRNLESACISADVPKGRGKRLGDDADVTGQPPLKRRLLEEFDRTVDGPRSSALLPQKCCPNSTINDRRAFKSYVSPHPNVTRPHGAGKQYVETTLQNVTSTHHSSSIGSRSTHSKTPTFVPPFIKNAKTETSQNAVVNVNRRARPLFVPPFKIQRAIVEDGSSKAQQQQREDKHHHHLVTPSHSSSHVPTSTQTQSSMDGAGNNSKADVREVALTDAAHDYLANNHRVLVGCPSEGSAVRATPEDDRFSRDISQYLEAVELARDMQDMRLRKKKRQTIRPLPGSLFLTKTSGVARIPLRSAVNGNTPARYTPKQLYGYGVLQHVCDITGETAETFRFNLQQFLKMEAFKDAGGVQLADGGWLIPSNDWTAGKEEFYRALCDTQGVDPKLISEEWVHNHYKWIVWKQASMERAFPARMGGLCLTPEQVLLQLKYRYDVEIDHSHRPALRKIMEKDDTSAKTLVLCVSGVVSEGQRPNRPSRSDTKTPQGANAKAEPLTAVVWLTDGWYAIKAQLDEPLTAMLHKLRLAVGGKLITFGAQLVGSQDACSPLEAPDSLMLKLCANSTRPARWDTKLGFHRDPRPFLLPLSCLYGNGGPVGCVDITILRSYPMQWMERKPDGAVVFRSVRAEEKEARRHGSQSQRAMEILFTKIQSEFELEQKGNNKAQRRRRTINRQDVSNLQDGEELYEAVENDSQYLEAHLSERQLETLQTYRRSLVEKKQAELQDRYRRALEAEDGGGSCPKRDVTPVWRLCVADSREQSDSVYQLSLWRPSSDLRSILKEGCRYKVYNLSTSEGKRRSGMESLQLTGTKKTQFQDLQASKEWLSTYFQPRVSTSFVTLQKPEFQPLCGEVDLTGFIISIVDGQGPSPAFYLADGGMNFVKVRCFGSFAQSGLEDVVKPRVLLALSNLQLRGQSLCPVVCAGDLTVFSTNPKELHLQESLSQLRILLQGQENYFLNAEEKLSHLLKSDDPSSFFSPAQHPPTPAGSTDRGQDVRTNQAARSLGTCTPVGKDPPTPISGTEKDPRGLKRRRALDYLSRIPSPPALAHLGSAASPCLKKTFNPPRRSETPSTLKTAQTPARKPVLSTREDEWVNDEELAMIDTQNLHVE